MSLTVDTTIDGARRTVRVVGEVDVSNADQLRSTLDEGLSAGETDLVVDLAEVPYIDSTGIGVLVGAAHRAAEKGVRLEVARPQRNVARVFGMLGVTSELNIGEEDAR